MTAVLTTARDMSEINDFPYLLALEPNATGHIPDIISVDPKTDKQIADKPLCV